MQDGDSIKDGRDLPIFIHSELDDYGLTPIEFRVYARLARRCGQDGATESVVNMANSFGVNRKTIQRCLQLLLRCRIIRIEIRPGFSNVYWLNPSHAWIAREKLSAIRQQAETCDISDPATFQTQAPSVAGDATPKTQGGATLETHKGTPTQGSPRRFSNSTTTARAKTPKAPKPPEDDEEWFESLKTNPTYSHIDIDVERGKMMTWCSVNNRAPTRKFAVNWLNRIQKPLKPIPQKNSNGTNKNDTQQNGMGPRTRIVANRNYGKWDNG